MCQAQIKSGKRQRTEEIELLSQESIRALGEKENYKYLRLLEVDNIKQAERSEKKIKKEYFRRTRKLLETKLNCRNLIKKINTKAVPSAPFLKWIGEELRKINQRTRKLMTLNNAWHLIDDIDRLYKSGKERGRGLASIGACIDATIPGLEKNIKKSKGRNYYNSQ